MKIMIKLMSFIMGRDYRKQLPSGDSQQQGDNSGARQESPRKQEKPDVNLQVINNRTAEKGHMVLYDPKEYERRVKAVLEGQMLVNLIGNTMAMLGQQQNLLKEISLDAMRNNSNKLVNLLSRKLQNVDQASHLAAPPIQLSSEGLLRNLRMRSLSLSWI